MKVNKIYNKSGGEKCKADKDTGGIFNIIKADKCNSNS